EAVLSLTDDFMDGGRSESSRPSRGITPSLEGRGRATPGAVAETAAEGLPPARDFVADGAGRAPILVFFTNASCPYCREVENLYLRPMHVRGDYRGRLLIRVVEVGGGAPLTDFTGQRTSHGEFARRERVAFTPVIRLYDATGRELAPQLFGYGTPDFYLGYLEQAIEQATATAHRQRTLSCAQVNAAGGCAPSAVPWRRAGG
ncbi:MAG: thioredoxin fold domain-containing protein, partial [Gemmatimonadales bacterium]|nr:thioredoxin fold domain-containing protein [Gemmatimonadales bacterium]